MIIIFTMTMIIIIIAILPSSSTHCGCPAWGRLEHRGRFFLRGVMEGISSKLLFWVFIIQKFAESWFIMPRIGLSWSLSHIIIMITSRDAFLFLHDHIPLAHHYHRHPHPPHHHHCNDHFHRHDYPHIIIILIGLSSSSWSPPKMPLSFFNASHRSTVTINFCSTVAYLIFKFTNFCTC